MKRAALIALAAVGLMAAEPAPPPDRPLPDVGQEARAQRLFDQVRCVVCQHEAIADSPAGIASDMRRLVRDQVSAGRTDAEVKADLVRRYGDFVLFKPPVRLGTWLLWFGPILGLLAVAGLLLAAARRKKAETAPLSTDEEARLTDILANGDLRRHHDAKPSDD
jgi:cytochrome c-type biogenesis protein CcmH